MNDRKSTSAHDGHTISDFGDARLSSRDTKTNKNIHDRPAIFIEKSKNQAHYNRSSKNN